MYIYEGHMGSLYASDYELDYKERYCEQCGDSDLLLGYAETREEAWNILKDDTATFDLSMCENCPYAEDYDYCNNECEDYQHSGGWDYNYVQEFLDEYWTD